MDGNEEGDGWGDVDLGDSVWEKEAASLSMFEPPPSQQASASSGGSGWGLAADFQRWQENKGEGAKAKESEDKEESGGESFVISRS